MSRHMNKARIHKACCDYWFFSFFVSADILVSRQNASTSWGFVCLWLTKLRSDSGGWRSFWKRPPFCLVKQWKPEKSRANLQVLSKRNFPQCYGITLFLPLVLFIVAVVVALTDSLVGFYYVRSMLKCFLVRVTGNAAIIQPLPVPFVSPTTVPGYDIDLLVAQCRYQHSCDPLTYDNLLRNMAPQQNWYLQQPIRSQILTIFHWDDILPSQKSSRL